MDDGNGYVWKQVYYENSTFGMWLAAWRAKRDGAGAVRITWR